MKSTRNPCYIPLCCPLVKFTSTWEISKTKFAVWSVLVPSTHLTSYSTIVTPVVLHSNYVLDHKAVEYSMPKALGPSLCPVVSLLSSVSLLSRKKSIEIPFLDFWKMTTGNATNKYSALIHHFFANLSQMKKSGQVWCWWTFLPDLLLCPRLHQHCWRKLMFALDILLQTSSWEQ